MPITRAYKTSGILGGATTNGETLVADSSATTGLRWQGNFAAGKNKIINGDFGIWQRGTSFTNLNDAYGADRFKHYITASAPSTYSITQQTFTPGTAPVAGYEGTYFLRQTAPTSGTVTEIDVAQVIEDVRTFAGQTITFSFWAKSSANLTLKSLIQQRFGSGGSAQVNLTLQSNSVTTSWQRFTHTMSVPSVAGKTIGANSGMWVFLFADTIATSQTIDTWGWQVEAGNTATAFQTATGTLAGELAACQRYYWRLATGANQSIGNFNNYNSAIMQGIIQFPVTMRGTPTLDSVSGTDFYKFVRNNGSDTFNSFTLEYPNATSTNIYNGSEISGTAGHAGIVSVNNASGYVGFSAEL